MPPDTRSRRPRVEVHLRGPADYGTYSRQEAVVDRLERLYEEGYVEDYTVETWGRSVPLAPEESAGEVAQTLDTVDAYRDWTARRGRSLEPAFRQRAVTVPGTSEHRQVLTLPVVCLAVYAGDDLAGVFPCSNGEVYTVSDALDALEAGEQWRERLP